MSAVTELLNQIQAAGIRLVLEGERLRYRPVDRMTPELAATIRAHRTMIVAQLAGDIPILGGENVRPAEAVRDDRFASAAELFPEPTQLPVKLGNCCDCGAPTGSWRCSPCAARITRSRARCYACRKTRWWQQEDGSWVCGTCHPDPGDG
jgi:hypothetical protein